MRTITCDSCGRQQDNSNNLYLATVRDGEGEWLIVEAPDPVTTEPQEYHLCSYLCLAAWATMMMDTLENRPN